MMEPQAGLRTLPHSLDEKLDRAFHAVVVDKRLVSQEGITRVPSYVSEWLIRRFFKDGVTTEARERMLTFVERHLPPQGKKEEVKARLRSLGSYKLIDHFSVTVDLKRNRYVLAIPSLDISDAYVEDELVERHDMLLSGGVWGAGRLSYEQNPATGEMIVRMNQFEPIQISSFDLELFIQKRALFTVEEWIDILIASQGLNPWAYPSTERKLLLLTRMLPMVQGNMNLVELAPKGTGKTHIYKNLSYYTHVISGGTVSPAVLFYNLGPLKMPGILATNDVVVFDEIQTINFERPGEIVGILKDYMESGSYTRGHKKVAAHASIVMQGNIELDSTGYPKSPLWFTELPKPMQETALIHRIHAFLPGWKLPKINVSEVALATGYGLAADYLSEALHALRSRDECDKYVGRRLKVLGTEDVRDEKAVRRIAAAFVKLLFPHLRFREDEEFERYCVMPAIEYRQYVRQQLHRLDEEFPDYQLAHELRPESAEIAADELETEAPHSESAQGKV